MQLSPVLHVSCCPHVHLANSKHPAHSNNRGMATAAPSATIVGDADGQKRAREEEQEAAMADDASSTT